MAELMFSKKIKERQKYFPWLTIYLKELLQNFQKDCNGEALQKVIDNVEIEVEALSTSGKAKRKEALFAVLYDLFLNIWWKIRWDTKKKLSRCWKTVVMIPYTCGEHSKYCGKVLYFVIYLGISLSQGCPDSEWTGKVLQAIHILPSHDAIVCDALLQIHNLQQKYQPAYIALLKHVLCTEVAENISQPALYITILILFRRLKQSVNDKITKSTLKSTASRIKPPVETIDWLSSVGINLGLHKNRSISKEFLSRSFPEKFIKKLQKVLSKSVNHEQKTNFQLSPSKSTKEDTKLENCKNKRKVHFKEDLNDVQTCSAVDSTSVSLDSNAGNGSNCKPSTDENKSGKKHKKRKHEDTVLSKKLRCRAQMFMADVKDESLNSSFAEISNISKEKVPLRPRMQLPKKTTKESKVPTQETHKLKSMKISDTTRSMHSTRSIVKAGTCNDLSDDKEAQLDSAVKSKITDQSIQKVNSIYSETKLQSVSISNLESTPICADKRSSFNHIKTNSPKGYMQDSPSISSCSSSITKTSDQQASSPKQVKKEKLSPVKVPYVSLLDIRHTNPALLKLIQLPDSQTNSNDVLVSYNTSQVESLCNNSNIAIVDSYSLKLSPQKDARVCEVSPNVFLNNNGVSQADTVCDYTIVEPATIESLQVPCLSENVNNMQNQEKNLTHTSFQQSSVNFFSSLASHDSWLKKKSNPIQQAVSSFCDDHRWEESESLLLQLSLQASQKCSDDSTENSVFSNEIMNENSFGSQDTESFGNVSVISNNIPSNLVIDCKIINDLHSNTIPTNTQNHPTPSIKVVVDIHSKTPEDNASQESEHIFGTFPKVATPNVTKNYLGTSTNLFSLPSSTPDMPNLIPYYEDLPNAQTSSLEMITTPKSNVDVIVQTPQESLTEELIDLFNHSSTPNDASNLPSRREELVNLFNHSSTPNDALNLPSRRTANVESDFRTPQTSDCESDNECNIENNNLNSSLNSSQCFVDDVVERLYKRISFSHKVNSSASTQDVSNYRTTAEIYSDEEFSENSTISLLSRTSVTDNEMDDRPEPTQASLKNSPQASSTSILVSKPKLKTSVTNDQSSTKIDKGMKKKRKSRSPRKKNEEDIVSGYSLRSRTKLAETSPLTQTIFQFSDDFF